MRAMRIASQRAKLGARLGDDAAQRLLPLSGSSSRPSWYVELPEHARPRTGYRFARRDSLTCHSGQLVRLEASARTVTEPHGHVLVAYAYHSARLTVNCHSIAHVMATTHCWQPTLAKAPCFVTRLILVIFLD